MRGEDLYSGSAIGGAGSGAATGAIIGSQIYPGYGTAIGGIAGGLIGGLTGAYANSQRSGATQTQQANLDALMRNLRRESQRRYREYLADLEKAESFYGPAQAEWTRLWGRPGSAPVIGQGSWSGTGVR
jgi:hypothetical protein